LFERTLEKLLGAGDRSAGHSRGASIPPLDDDVDARREAAEALHALGTAEALRRLGQRPGHEAARALLRDARWDVPGAGPVPLVGQPGGLTAARILATLRLRHALRLARQRWAAACAGGAAARAVAGALGGLALRLAPRSHAPAAAAVVITGRGGQLAGTSLDFVARSFQGSHVGVAPLARMLGEPELGPLSRAVIGAYEGAFFGFGLALGLTRRPL